MNEPKLKELLYHIVLKLDSQYNSNTLFELFKEAFPDELEPISGTGVNEENTLFGENHH